MLDSYYYACSCLLQDAELWVAADNLPGACK